MNITHSFRRAFFLIPTLFLALGLSADGATITWNTTSSGNWSNTNNWSPQQVPTSADDVVISVSQGITVTLDVPAFANSLSFTSTTGATLSGANPIFVGGSLNLANGAIAAAVQCSSLNWIAGNISGIIQCGGGNINVPSAASSIGFGGQLINTGVLTWTPNGGPRTGGAGGTVISNAASGTMNVTLNGNSIDNFAYGYSSTFYNAGQINVSGSGQTGSITSTFLNEGQGTVTVNSGALYINGGGTDSDSGGGFSISSGATLDIGGSYTFNAGSLITGLGNFAVSGGTVTVGGALNAGGSWAFGGGTANLTGSTTVSANTVNVSGGTVNFNGSGNGGSWLPGTINLSDGAIGGTTPVSASGSLTWTGGNISGIILCAGGSINVPSAAYSLGFGGQLINTGVLTWTPNGGPRTGGSGGTVISNAASGTINVTLNNGNSIDNFAYGYSSTFYNAGQINVSGAGQTGSITSTFLNEGTGTVTVNSGALYINGGGTDSDSGGGFSIASGATLDMGGSYTFNAGSLITGLGNFTVSVGTVGMAGALNAGGSWTFSGGTANLTGNTTVGDYTVNVTGGTVNFNGTGNGGSWTPGAINLSNGAIAGTAPIFDSGLLTWTGGNISGIIQCAGGSINVPSAGYYLGFGGQLINTGVLAWTANGGPRTGGSGGTVISNAASGTINVTLNNGNSIDNYAYGYGSTFYNQGQINVSGAGQTGSITSTFLNTGTLNIQSGTLLLSGGGTETGPTEVGSGATLNLNGGTFTFNTGSAISGAGSFTMSGGTANLETNLLLSGSGTLTVSGGAVTVDGSIGLGGTWTFTGGTANLNGSSTVSGNTMNVNGGTVNFNGTGNGGSWTPGAINLSNGAIGGTAPIFDSGLLTWTGGNISGIVLCTGGSINVPSAGYYLGFGGQLINTGVLTWTPNGGPRTGGSGGTVISNAASGTINVTLNGNSIDNFAYGYSSTFYNAGQINVSGAGQTGSITSTFDNTGTLNIQSGTLNVTAASTWTNGTLSFGISSAASYGTLVAPSGNFAFSNMTLSAIANGYTPSVGDSFPLITYGSETGLFNAFNLPPHANWQPEYGPTVFSLVVASLTAPYITLQPILPEPYANRFTMLMLGPAGSNYTIQACDNLAAKPPVWIPLTNFLMTDSSIYFTDTNIASHIARIYDAVSP